MNGKATHRVVIVGAGFGGLNAATALAGADVNITVIDQKNYHTFQPLLYQVATAGLSPGEIAEPIRSILHRHKNIQVLMAEVTGFDLERRVVHIADQDVPYDSLVVAAGASQRRGCIQPTEPRSHDNHSMCSLAVHSITL